MTIPITFTITSCNRLDLLETTVNSFLQVNGYPIDEFILSDDSGDDETYEKIVSMFGNQFKIIKNISRLGLSKSLDNLFVGSKNEFIFHCEDDWMFDKNPNLISDSLEILIENSNIHQVSVRHEYDNPHKPIGDILFTSKKVPFRLMSQNFKSMPTQIWNGYSWNPGLRRKSDFIKMFPNGISSFGDEYLCCDHTKNFNYLSAVLINTSCYHIGYNNRTPNFKI